MLKSKSKTKNEVAVTTQEDPRAAMKQVRSQVKQAVKENRRVDEMGYKGRDVARSQIALQDMLTKEQEKRRKAEGHIIASQDMIETISFNASMLLGAANAKAQRHQSEVAQLHEAILQLQNENNALRADNAEVRHLNAMQRDDADREEQKLAAALQTIKTMSEGVDFA